MGFPERDKFAGRFHEVAGCLIGTGPFCPFIQRTWGKLQSTGTGSASIDQDVAPGTHYPGGSYRPANSRCRVVLRTLGGCSRGAHADRRLLADYARPLLSSDGGGFAEGLACQEEERDQTGAHAVVTEGAEGLDLPLAEQQHHNGGGGVGCHSRHHAAERGDFHCVGCAVAE